ncbi:rhodanese-like domain-containing protein [Clostridium tyrobutyricum]|uniref:rhodanese-like domain-containing protein n=1 Tax=Clostridium tyrobutyricum TaxID=1519 RepID=UPI0002DEBC17|nr:rhodanese-like domain-containing protein [Clostridium tyrobutyricum]MBV4417337.1 rhodanese-like domain-containing protein [Clostridium tyrobutyricum]MBV4423080.1 rhodanese-like domain-containing protein [Clostridium tyrobutyricum]MBV4425966.1 rhodanese-like domain-containing protein [Clostridium tyrobutyricum]MBV4427402.1 rhodanese-like domain-containing protein [Clostridium tyrobutyricum]MBV4437826.1 rhodanese-like domain-containing protein [Clostridium tyrobutyricum]
MKHFRIITDKELKKLLEGPRPPILIDVRDNDEFCKGHIKTSKNIPIEDFEDAIKEMKLNNNAIIVVYCKTGKSSLIACNILKDLGFKKIYNFRGIDNWHYKLKCN